MPVKEYLSTRPPGYNPARMTRTFRLPAWAPLAAMLLSLALAWGNFLGTARWATLDGSLHGGRKWWYLAALIVATVLTLIAPRRLGREIDPGFAASRVFLLVGAGVLLSNLLIRMPLAVWGQIPFEDDWTPLFQAAAHGVHVLERGAVMSWNWWFLGGYPTSTDVAQSFAMHLLIPMELFGDRIGFHVLHAIWLLSLPLFVWWDVRQDDPKAGLIAGAIAGFMVAGFSVGL